MFNFYRREDVEFPEQFKELYENGLPEAPVKYSNYVVRPNDTLDGIALKYFTTPMELINLNAIDPRNFYPGLVIQVPLLQPPEEFQWYEVKPGDSLWTILESIGVPREFIPQLVKEVASVNQISPGDLIYPTENILIPIQAKELFEVYEVKPGDTLDSVSINQDVSVDQILFNNKNLFLQPGQKLLLPKTL